MKKILFIALMSVFVFVFMSCGDTDLDTYDFSNSLPNYVEFKSTDPLSVKQGEKATFIVNTKNSFFKDAEVVVKIEGEGLSETKTIVFPRMKTSVSGDFTIPETVSVGVNFTITLVSANVEGNDIRLGRINETTTKINGKVVAAK